MFMICAIFLHKDDEDEDTRNISIGFENAYFGSNLKNHFKNVPKETIERISNILSTNPNPKSKFIINYECECECA